MTRARHRIEVARVTEAAQAAWMDFESYRDLRDGKEIAAVRHAFLTGYMQAEATSVSLHDAPRFYIDHGMIHDRVTGKHVDPTPVEYDAGAWDMSPVEEVCALLNCLAQGTETDHGK